MLRVFYQVLELTMLCMSYCYIMRHRLSHNLFQSIAIVRKSANSYFKLLEQCPSSLMLAIGRRTLVQTTQRLTNVLGFQRLSLLVLLLSHSARCFNHVGDEDLGDAADADHAVLRHGGAANAGHDAAHAGFGERTSSELLVTLQLLLVQVRQQELQASTLLLLLLVVQLAATGSLRFRRRRRRAGFARRRRLRVTRRAALLPRHFALIDRKKKLTPFAVY